MRAKIFALALTAIAVSACDKATDPSSSLTAAEVRAIVVAIDDAGAAAVQSEQSGAAQLNLTPTRPAPDIISHEGSFNFSGECDLGGTAAIAGTGAFSLDSDAGTIDLDLDATGTYADCAFKTDKGIEIAIGGTVDFLADRHVSFQQGIATGSQSYAGSLDYVTSDGKEGTCPIDVAATFSLSEGSATRTITGNFCDQEVDVTSSWTAGT